MRWNLYVIKCTLLEFGQIHIPYSALQLSQQLRNRTLLLPQKFPLALLHTGDYFVCSRMSCMKSYRRYYSFVASLCSALRFIQLFSVSISLFLMPHSISLYQYIQISLSIHLLMGICTLYSFELYENEHSCKSLFTYMFSFLFGKYVGVELLGHTVSVCLTL